MTLIDDVASEVLERTNGDVDALRQVIDQLDQRLGALPLERTMRLWDLSAAQLGSMFGVSRQAATKWLSDGPPAARARQVAVLAQCTDLLDRWVKRERIPAVVRRPVDSLDGRSRLDVVLDGDFDTVRDELIDTFDIGRVAR